MKNIKLTNKELRALKALINEGNPCSSGCAFEEMQRSKKDCDECDFMKAKFSILDKIEGL